ncbi:Coiled-coil domain-containing protein 43 [Phytophthora cinnamomi]|nr:Coiled-coil domain-containing protein 43 [Phytophthora cinnamomi]
MDVSERVASVVAVFSGAADGLVAPEVLERALDEAQMTQDVSRLLQAAQQQSQQQQELELAQKQLRDLQLRERQKQEAEAAAEREKRKAAERLKNMTREQIAAREQLISEYGFTVMSEFDEDGNVVKIKDKDRSSAAEDAAGPANSNRQRLQQAQSAMREKMKKEHEKKVKYEKELLAKDKARKDKAKKRTVKREKQRGCG